jgi:hypothetical protein
MQRKPSKRWVLGILSITFLWMGCASKKPVTPASSGFRFQAMQQGSLLFSPDIPNSQLDKNEVKLLLDGNTAFQAIPSACSATSGSFRLEHANDNLSSMTVTLPSPENWLGVLEGREQTDEAGGIDSLYAFLADLDRSQQAGCFADSKFSPREYVLQSIPMKPSESLFSAYGYRLERSGLDLKPGLRLKIERAYFRLPSAGEEEHDVKNYLGVSTLEMSVELADDGNIHFQQIGDIKYSPASLKESGAEGNRDIRLKDLQEQPSYRLLFYSYLVPKEHHISAAILGAENASRLDELEQELRDRPEEGCKAAELQKRENCFDFQGFVTITAQINIELNGKLAFVDWGTKLRTVVPEDYLKNLRIQRKFMNTYYDVSFDPAKSDILSLALIGGDHLAWTQGKAAGH